jgi:hypothetical protein
VVALEPGFPEPPVAEDRPAAASLAV